MKPEMLQKCLCVPELESVCTGLPSFTYVMENPKSYQMKSYEEITPPETKCFHLVSSLVIVPLAYLLPNFMRVFFLKNIYTRFNSFSDLAANLGGMEGRLC